MSPLFLVDGMLRGKTVICSRLGGLTEFVEDGVTGVLFVPGDARDRAGKIRYLWERPDLCRAMGDAGRKKALATFSLESNYIRRIETYRHATNGQPALGPELADELTAT